MSKLQYTGPETDDLKPGKLYDPSKHPEVDDELWCTPAFEDKGPKHTRKADVDVTE